MLKVGDKVKIKKDLENYKEYGGLTFIGESMGKYRGKEAIIVETQRVDEEDIYYLLDIDNEYWSWSKDMFEKIDKINSYIIVFQNHDSIKINILQDINRPNNQDDYDLILDYIYFNYGCVASTIIELEEVYKEINI